MFELPRCPFGQTHPAEVDPTTVTSCPLPSPLDRLGPSLCARMADRHAPNEPTGWVGLFQQYTTTRPRAHRQIWPQNKNRRRRCLLPQRLKSRLRPERTAERPRTRLSDSSGVQPYARRSSIALTGP